MFKKLVTKIAMKVMCFQLKRKAGLGKPFQRVLDTENITAAFNEKQLLYFPVYIHVNVKEDKYYFTHDGKLVGFGQLDGLDPVTIIKKDCLAFAILYNYMAAYAMEDSKSMDKMINDDVLFNYLVDELKQLVLLSKEKAA